MNLENVGNIREFENPQRKVCSHSGVWKSSKDDLCLKLYDMYTRDPSNQKMIYNLCDFLNKEFDERRIDSRSGFGFVILSESNLNVARWDDKYPIILVNTLYEITRTNKEILTSEILDINKFGAFCIWELGIVNHEKESWKKYLASKREHLDKENYLFNVIEGDL